MYEQVNQSSFVHNFDTAYVSSPVEDCLADNIQASSLKNYNEEAYVPTANPGGFTWRDGRRIVELDRLAEQMKSCLDCGQPFILRNIQRETKMGFANILYIDCAYGVLNSVTRNKYHNINETLRGPRTFDVNTKAALGELNKIC